MKRVLYRYTDDYKWMMQTGNFEVNAVATVPMIHAMMNSSSIFGRDHFPGAFFLIWPSPVWWIIADDLSSTHIENMNWMKSNFERFCNLTREFAFYGRAPLLFYRPIRSISIGGHIYYIHASVANLEHFSRSSHGENTERIMGLIAIRIVKLLRGRIIHFSATICQLSPFML